MVSLCMPLSRRLWIPTFVGNDGWEKERMPPFAKRKGRDVKRAWDALPRIRRASP